MSRRPRSPDCCSIKPTLAARPLLSPEQATVLMGVFKVFANDTRLRLLHALARVGEMRVNDLAEAVSMTPQAVSNQLQRLVDQGMLESRRERTSIYYRIVDSCVTSLLDQGLCLAEDAESRRGKARVVETALGSPSRRSSNDRRRRGTRA